MVVFCRFTPDIQAAIKQVQDAGRTCGELSGQANDLELFQNGTVKTLVVQVQAGGVGIELQHCGDDNTGYCVLYSKSFSLLEYEQILKRTHRPGQKKNVKYIDLQAENTVDGKINKALKNKKQNIDEFLRELKEED
jgi:SNF2 family DNA or RNA helicase